MPPVLTLVYKEKELPFNLTKVDRTKLYGFVETEVKDEQGEKCSLATLADDGRTLIGSGGITQAYFTVEDRWVDKKDLKPVDLVGNEIEPVKSTFKEPVELTEKTTVDFYLDHNIRMVYQLEGEEVPKGLLKELKAGAIFTFPFSYRGGLEPDQAFIFTGAEDETIWLAVGKPGDIHFVGLEQSGTVEAEPEEEPVEEEDLMDFGMM